MSKHRIPHLVFTNGVGFQYHLPLPKALQNLSGLPKSVRWSLGNHYETAKQLADKLNKGFDKLSQTAPHMSADQALLQIEHLRTLNYEALENLERPLGSLLTPHQLATHPLNSGYRAIEFQSQHRPVIFERDGSFFAHVTLPYKSEPAPLLFTVKNWTVPLGTQDLQQAKWRTAYLLEALQQLADWQGDGYIHAHSPEHAYVIAMRQYLGFINALPAQGLEKNLTTNSERVMSKQGLPKLDLPFIRYVVLSINARGEYLLRVFPKSDHAVQEFPLRTTDRTLAILLILENYEELNKQLIEYDQPSCGDNSQFQKLIRKIKKLLDRFLKDLPEPEELPEQPTHWPNDATRLSFSFDSSLIRFGTLVERYAEYQTLCQTWTNPDTRVQMLGRLNALSELVGPDMPVLELTRQAVVQLRDKLRLFPHGRNRKPELRSKPLFEIFDSGKYIPIQAVTAKRYFATFKQLLAYAHDQGFITTNPAFDVEMKVKARMKVQRTYSEAQLTALLRGPALISTDIPAWRLDDYKFWLPLLGLYTGARLNELCQLSLADIRTVDGILFFSLNTDAPGKRLKNASSHRNVPIHPKLIEFGFMELVEKRRQETENDQFAPLFDGLHIIKNKLPGAYASKWYLGDGHNNMGYLNLCSLRGLGLTFHGLRHTFVGQFRAQRLDMDICKALVGHTDSSTTGQYGNSYPLEALYHELCAIDYKLDTSAIHYPTYRGRQLQQRTYRRGRPKTMQCSPLQENSGSHWRRLLK